jgi:hypothetical protein
MRSSPHSRASASTSQAGVGCSTRSMPASSRRGSSRVAVSSSQAPFRSTRTLVTWASEAAIFSTLAVSAAGSSAPILSLMLACPPDSTLARASSTTRSGLAAPIAQVTGSESRQRPPSSAWSGSPRVRAQASHIAVSSAHLANGLAATSRSMRSRSAGSRVRSAPTTSGAR